MELLTAKQTARLLNCSVPLIYKMAGRKQIPCVRWQCPGDGDKKPRTMVRFKLMDIQEFIDKHTVTC
jgi:Helix-turn-helix domain